LLPPEIPREAEGLTAETELISATEVVYEETRVVCVADPSTLTENNELAPLMDDTVSIEGRGGLRDGVGRGSRVGLGNFGGKEVGSQAQAKRGDGHSG
jgi:hypothetical protein